MSFQAVVGVSGNLSCNTFAQLQLSFRLLRIHDILLSKTAILGELPEHIACSNGEKGRLESRIPILHCNESKKQHAEAQSFADDEFISNLLSSSTVETSVEKNNSGGPNSGALASSQEKRMKKYLIQPGAATGRSAEQVMRVRCGVTSAQKASVLASAGLRLLTSILPELQRHPLLAQHLNSKHHPPAEPATLCSTEAGGEKITKNEICHENDQNNISDLLNETSKYVVACFCGSNDEFIQIASKCLVKLLSFNLEPVHKYGRQIALTILR